MRVLFTTWAWPSHLYALVPLASAFRAAGHEVLIASQPALKQEIERTGLPAAVVGEDVDAVGMVRGYVLPSAAGEAAGGPQAPKEGKGPRALRMFWAHAESMTDGLVDLARDWRADAVVYEPTALAGPIAAAAVGIPAIRVLYGTDLMLRARKLLPELLSPLAERHGVTDFDPLGAVTVDPCPDTFQVPTDYPRLPMRHVPYNGVGMTPGPLGAPAPGVRRVLVTWGHTMARLSPGLFLAGEVADALRGADTEVVLAVTAAQRGLLEPALLSGPGAVRVVEDAPLHALMPGTDLVVAHGGAGTVLTALRGGVPLLLVPQLPDHTGHAGRVFAAGAGEVLSRDEATPQRLREEAGRLLDPEAGAAVRETARRLRAEMRDRPSPSDIVNELRTKVISCAA
ncbi:nucleotide disphospho-sugar-binding domain-containing protein [Streptomyces sp. NPDC005474]|uniref:nucleotide disphospho-sugar-binding domain-containing protein n=1 Tax=Streptomyces sp. NPDC005474 TaxID=3154878 RepID=UPI0034516180